MTAEQLKNSILQEAISGRLVPQDPNDEPASVLLQHIREEKARLVKEGKLKKKDLVETPITEDEIPFEIPSSWGWIKLKDLFHFLQGIQVDKEKQSEIQKDDQVRFLRIIDYTQGNEPPRYIDDPGERYHIKSKDLVMIRYGSPGLPCRGYDGVLANNLFRIIPYSESVLDREYTYRFFTSPYFQSFCNAYGVALSAIKFSTINEVLFPLPPLAEQKRIVAKLEELLPIVEQYGKAQKELDELNAALHARLRQSILQEAISGRLVPQDPNDEPAAFVSTVPEDEIPFEIPSSWRWVFLKDCAAIIGGYAFPSASIKGEKGVRVIRISDISEKGFVNKSVVRYNGNDNLEKFKVLPQDILMAMTGGTVGKSLFVKEMDEEMLLNQRVAIIRNNGQYAPYLDMVVKSPHIKSFINDKKNSTNDNISMGDINNFLIPLPPLAEQQRIVAKIEELFEQIDKLK